MHPPLPVFTPDTLTGDVSTSGCPQDHVAEVVEKLTDGIYHLALDALDTLNSLEKQWAEEDRV